MVKWFIKMLDRIFAVIGAFLFAQFPFFIQQYTHRLSGHINELSYQVKRLSEAATQSGKTLEQFVQKFVSSHDSDFKLEGELMQEMIVRLKDLSYALESLLRSTPLSRPFSFFYHANWDVVKGTFSSYNLGIPFTLEGAIYALIGIFAGHYFYVGLSAFFNRVAVGFKRAQSKKDS